MTAPTRLRAHYVLSTHWDREWYQSFQNYRYQLVRLLDRVLGCGGRWAPARAVPERRPGDHPRGLPGGAP
jgi:hypothetical protein